MPMPPDADRPVVPTALQRALEIASARHTHLCPRQVLGARAAIAGTGMLQLEAPRADKRLLVIVETDGCFVDGVEAATGVSVGRRTLRVEDYGKMAATFVDVKNGRALRVAPQVDVRGRAGQYAPQEKQRYFGMLHGYQRMPDGELLSFAWVELAKPLAAIVSRAGARVNCGMCGEEIINEREVVRRGQAQCQSQAQCRSQTLCQSCAGGGYYSVKG